MLQSSLMDMASLIIKALASWRLAHMLMYERGPYDVLTKARRIVFRVKDIDGEIISYPDNSLIECIYCVSIWTASAQTEHPLCKRVSNILAISAVAILIDSVNSRWLNGA